MCVDWPCFAPSKTLILSQLEMSADIKDLDCLSVFFAGLQSRNYFWPDCKAIPAYGLMMSVCLSSAVSPSVSLSDCQHFG